MMLKHFMRSLHIHLHVGAAEANKAELTRVESFDNLMMMQGTSSGGRTVPEDVKEGEFAVLAMKSEEPKRFVVELRFLTNPAFLRLLKKAEEEYGFSQKGVLAVPCRPEDLSRILQTENISHAWTH